MPIAKYLLFSFNTSKLLLKSNKKKVSLPLFNIYLRLPNLRMKIYWNKKKNNTIQLVVAQKCVSNIRNTLFRKLPKIFLLFYYTFFIIYLQK